MTQLQRESLDRFLRSHGFGLGDDPQQMRTGFAQAMAALPVPSGAATSEVSIGGLRALRIVPDAGSANGTILYFHGGGHVFGSPETHVAPATQLALRTGTDIVLPDYRLAPEHPFPADVEDCAAAYRDLLATGADPARIVVAGDSAGGALTLTTLLTARHENLPMPAAAVAFSPGGDATRTGTSLRTRAAADPVFTVQTLARFDELYLAGADPNHELASPVVSAALHGLPPMLLQTGSNEILMDNSVRLAERLVAADVDVVLDVTAGVPHVFQSFVELLDEAGDALDRAALFIRQHLSAA